MYSAEDDKLKDELLNNFIYEFDMLFGKYVSIDEVKRRIQRHLEKIVFLDMEDTYVANDGSFVLGRYIPSEKKIEIQKNMDWELIKSTFFHEMIHCITTADNNIDIGFNVKYNIYGNVEEDEIFIGVGINEGTTEYLTKIRNKKFGETGEISYPILVEQVENLIEIIGIDKYLDCFFNSPEQIFELIDEKFNNRQRKYSNKHHGYDLITDLDVICYEEKNICHIREQNDNITNEYLDMRTYFHVRNILDIYKIYFLEDKFESIDDFKKCYKKLREYSSKLACKLEGEELYDLLSEASNLEREALYQILELEDLIRVKTYMMVNGYKEELYNKPNVEEDKHKLNIEVDNEHKNIDENIDKNIDENNENIDKSIDENIDENKKDNTNTLHKICSYLTSKIKVIEQEIGKLTINVSTQKKDQALQQYKKFFVREEKEEKSKDK